MTKQQLNSFQKSLSSFQEVEHIKIGKTEYLLIWWLDKDNKRRRLDFVFVLYENTLLRRIEVDGFLRSYVLNSLEKALKE